MKPDAAGALERWLHRWTGLGDVIVGMSAQGFDVELKQFPGAWRATFYPAGSRTRFGYGTAYEPRRAREPAPAGRRLRADAPAVSVT